MNGKQLKNSILQWAIQGKLVEQNPKDEPACKLLERIAAQRVIASLPVGRQGGAKQSKKNPTSRLPAGRQCIYREGSSWFEESKDTQGLPAGRRDITEEIPFDIPENWVWTRMGNIGSWGAGATPAKGNPEFYNNGVIPWLVTGELNNSIVTDTKVKVSQKALEKCSLRLCKPGDILIAMYGATIGKLAIAGIELTTNQACCACTLHYDFNKYLFYFLMASKTDLTKRGEGGAQPNISKEKLVNYLIPLPPLAEQKRIVKKLEQILPLVDEYDHAQTQLDKLNKELPEALKKSILQQAIQGKLVPPACRLAGRTQNLPGFEKGKWYTYVIECEDGSFYKGHTSNLSNRFKEHCAGKGADWTASHKPKQVYYYEVHYGEEEAISREKYLKSGAGREWFQKEVVNSPENWEPASKLLERIAAARNGDGAALACHPERSAKACDESCLDQSVILSGAKNLAKKTKKKKPAPTSRIYREGDSWFEQIGTAEPKDITEEIPFDIPESWEWCRWGEISESIQYGFNAPALESGRIKMVRISDIQNNSILWDKVPYCQISDAEIENYRLRKNDILFARTGGTVGKSYLVQDVKEDAVFAGYLIRTSYNYNLLIPEYLKFFMESSLYWSQLREGTIATAQPNCNGKTLGNMLIPLPPLAEQKRIVAKLEQIFKAL